MEGVKDVQGGTVRSSAPGLHGGRDEHARGCPRVRSAPGHGAQDAGVLGASRVPSTVTGPSSLSWTHTGGDRPDTGGGPQSSEEAAAHCEADLRAPESGAQLHRQVHDSQGLRARAASPDARDVRSAVPPCRSRPVRLRSGEGGDRRSGADPSATSCWTFPTATGASSRPTPQRRPRRSATVTSRRSRSWVACPGASCTTTRGWRWPGSWETAVAGVLVCSPNWCPTIGLFEDCDDDLPEPPSV